jgi:hypothetical protein
MGSGSRALKLRVTRSNSLSKSARHQRVTECDHAGVHFRRHLLHLGIFRKPRAAAVLESKRIRFLLAAINQISAVRVVIRGRCSRVERLVRLSRSIASVLLARPAKSLFWKLERRRLIDSDRSDLARSSEADFKPVAPGYREDWDAITDNVPSGIRSPCRFAPHVRKGSAR